MYNDYTPDQNDRIDDYSGQGDNFDNQDLYSNDQDLYNNDTQDLYSNDAQDLYNEQDMYQPQEDNQMNVDAVIYGNEAMQSNPVQDQEDQEVDIYKMQEDQIKQEAMLAHQNEMLNNQPQQAGKKSRFPFGRKKQQDQPQPQPMVSNVIPNMVPNMGQQSQSNGAVTAAKVRKDLQPFAARGNNIVVTGCGGCGTSTIAYSLANIINQLGFTVLLIDFDTEGRAQNYISRANYESMEPEGANLMAAVNSSTNFQSHVSVVRSGFHLLTMGLGSDVAPVSEMLQEDRIQRFLNLAKSSSHFIIYDVPFNSAKGFLKDVTYRADNLVLTVDASNWGVTKTMLSVCNIEENDMQDVMFNKAQIVFNKYRNLNTVFGKPVKTGADIEKAMDRKVIELLGEDPGFHFSDMHIAGIINDDPDFEKGWFADVAYAETKKGQDIFLKLIDNIVLKKS
jgi:Mrp family chromosome partitioning ATPase